MVKRLIVTVVAIAAGVSVSNMDVWAAVGRTPGQFAVTPTGSAQYSIPIWTPPGIRGLQPKLALVYDGQLSYGIMGPGWTLSGLSTITRCNATYAQDGTPAPITLTSSDKFCVDGNRLRPDPAGSTTTYQTEIANFSQVTATAGTNGPSSFTIKSKDGLTYEYGVTSDSKILPCSSGCSTPYIWALDKVTDRSGNQMILSYQQTSGSYVPLHIQYTAPAGSTAFPYEITFQYTELAGTDPNTLTSYVAGSKVQQPQQLANITVTSSGTIVREYKMSYGTSTDTKRNILKTIQECGNPTGAGGTASDCLAATSVGYQSGSAGIQNPTSATGSGATNAAFFSADIDGDGRMDLIYATGAAGSYTWWVQLATASGFGSPINTGAVTPGIANVLIDHFTGAANSQILVQVSGKWASYSYNASTNAFAKSLTNTPVTTGAVYSSADVNGDGLPDLVYVLSAFNFTAGIQENTGAGSSVAFATTPVIATIPGAPGACDPNYAVCPTYPIVNLYGNNQFPYSSVKHFDFDGDGRQDLVLYYRVTQGSSYVDNVVTLLSRGTAAFAEGLVVPNSGNPVGNILPAVWNDDNCTDLLVNTSIYVSQCNGSYGATVSVQYSPFLALDWDGDGRTDFISETSSTWYLYQSQGGGYTSSTLQGFYIGTGGAVVLDQNGDGLDDIAYSDPTHSNALYYGLHNGAFQKPDLADSFVDGFGNSVAPTYTTILQGSFVWGDQVYPYQNYTGPLYIAVNAVFSDPSIPSSGTYSQHFYYAGASMNLQGRGFAGFGAQQVYDSRNETWDTINYDRVFPYTGMMSYRVTAQDNLNTKPIITVSPSLAAETLDGTANNQRYFPYTSVSTTQYYEVGGSKNTQLVTSTNTNYGSPDTYGNFDTVTTAVTDEDSGSPYYGDTWTSTISNSITANTANWCLNLPTQTSVTNSSTAPGGASITRTVNYTPDYTNCRETQKVTAPGTAYQVTEVYGFDGFGNINSDAVTGVNMATRTTGINWGTSGQFPTVITNALGQSITLGYDLTTGMKTSQTDPNYSSANLLQTKWKFDDFNRETQETRTDGTYTVWAYNDCATSDGCLFGAHAVARSYSIYASNGALQNTGVTYYDTVDRSIMSTTQSLSGYNRNEVRYDSLGRVAKQAMPCTYTAVTTACPYWSTPSYDILNRVTQVQRPISASNSAPHTTYYGYAGRTTTVQDALGNTTTKISLVNGALARSQDAKGYYQNFTYDAFGSLTAVTDSGSNALFGATYAYGISAFQTTSSDMDLGARSYTVDALGEVTTYSDANGRHFSQTYDALSRPLVRTDYVESPDLVTTWTWGSSATYYNIGKLQSVTAAGANGTYGESYGYDSFSRLSTDAISVPSDSTYTYTYGYNPTTGQLYTLTYPTSTPGYSLELQYGYTNGILQQVADAHSSTVFWKNTGMNPRGQVTQETLGNGIVTNRTFDAVTGWLSSIQSGTSGGGVASVQNQSLAFDEDGNLMQRQDNNQGLNENFYYDADNRLDHSTLNGTLNLQMTYDSGHAGPGNITARSDVAGGSTWTYDAVRKHAVTQAGTGGYAYTYDANGNVTNRNGYPITWASYNYPVAISGPNKDIILYYGPNRQYYEQVYYSGSTIEKTIYAGGLLEKVTNGSLVDWRHYIRVDNELVAIMSRQSSGTIATHYMLSDHLGSIAAITDGSAATTVSESFSAFGTRRNPSTWSGIPTCPDLCDIAAISREGYTGHDAIGGVSMGLNHMNGRVQDAITGRFLSPDPYIPDPGNTQSYNRYTYVNNNPLSRVDPTGFDDCGDSCTSSSTSTYIPTTESNMFTDAGAGSSNVASTGPQFTPGFQVPPDVAAQGLSAASGNPASQITDTSTYMTPSPDDGYLDTVNVLGRLNTGSAPGLDSTTSLGGYYGGGYAGNGGGQFGGSGTPNGSPSHVSGGSVAQGHAYSTRNQICQRPLTAPEISDLISRFTVPNVYLQGQPLSAGIHMVAAWGIPGGFVTTTFSADGLTGFNKTTPFHIFTGTVVRSVDNTGTGADMVTYGYGGYPPGLPTSPNSSSLTTSSIDIGAILDQMNNVTGPMVFNAVDQQAARFAQNHYTGC
jgi:RHS repeat-associated protein